MLIGFFIILLGIIFFLSSNSKGFVRFLRKIAGFFVSLGSYAAPSLIGHKEKDFLTIYILKIVSIFLVIFGIILAILDYFGRI